MQTKPLITFIVPVYHVPEEMVGECLQSIFNIPLTEAEREVIVVDDGNEDDIAHNWQEDWRAQITMVRQSNQGLAAARNTGIEQASGEYVQFVDSDDLLLPNLYGNILRFATDNEADLLTFRLYSHNKQRNERFHSTPHPVAGNVYMEHNNLRPSACGYLFKRSLLNGLRFNASLRTNEDEDFTPRLFLNAKRVFATDATPYYYRVREGSIMHKGKDYFVKVQFPNIERILCGLQHLDVSPEKQAGLDRRVAQLTMDYVYNIIRHTHSFNTLEEKLRLLTEQGLYPFPPRRYTWKYTLFRHLAAHRITRRLLIHLIR